MKKMIQKQSNKTDILRDFFICEYNKYLENKGIDTVCFMGYGYDFEDVKVGAEFYLSYLFWGRNAALFLNAAEDVLKSVLGLKCYNEFELDDKFVLIQKYKYFNCKIVDNINRKTIDAKARREYVRIKNTRTGEVKVLNDEWIDNFNLFLFVSW